MQVCALPGSGIPYDVPDGHPLPSGATLIADPGAPIHEGPAKKAPKAEWVAHAIALGVDRAEAEGLTKAALLQRAEEIVAATESSRAVNTDMELVDDGPQADDLGTGPVDRDTGGEDPDGDSDVVGHEG